MSDTTMLEKYLVRLEKAIEPIPASERAEIILEIKSHVHDSLDKNPDKSVSEILAGLGDPELVADKYLSERGLKKKSELVTKKPVAKWFTIGFLGTLSIIVLTLFILIWKFTPLVSISETDGKVSVLGGLVSVGGGHGGGESSNDAAEYQSESYKEIGAKLLNVESITKTFKASDIKRLEIKNSSGNSTIIGGKDPEVRVDVEKIKWNNKCKLIIDEKSATLIVSTEKGKGFFTSFSKRKCKVNIKVTMPTNADIVTKTGSGNTDISNINGSIDIKAGSGNLKIENSKIAKLGVRLGSGQVVVSGELADVDIRAGSGNLNLTSEKTPLKGTATVRAGSGNVTFNLPEKSEIKVDFKAGSGRMFNDFVNNQNAKYKISMKAGSGNLNIKKIMKNYNANSKKNIGNSDEPI